MTIPLSSEGLRFPFWGCAFGFFLVSFCMACIGPVGKHLYLFSTLYICSFLFLFGLLWTFPSDWSTKNQWVFIFFVSFVIRLAFLFFPISNDVGRYIWEGAILNKGFNPYIHPPNDPILEPISREMNEVWQIINHKDASACYPPLMMFFFRFAAFFSPTPIFFNIFIVLFDLATIWVLALLLRSYKIPPNRLLLYALNPLVLVFIAGEGHLGAIQVFFICFCFYLFTRGKEEWGFFSLGCAIMSKYFAGIVAPFLINARNWKKSLFLFVALLVFYLPFWNTGRHLFDSLVPFGTVMHYNDSLTALLRIFFGSNTTWISVFLLGICLVIIFLVVHDPFKSAYLAIGALLLLLPTLHPWYLSLITPFLVFFPSRAWLYLHLSVVFTFPVLHMEYYSGVFQEVHFLKLLEYLPFYGLLIWDTFQNRRIFHTRPFEAVSWISVIIPTLNESQNIGGCLKSLQSDRVVMETIVVDGGSTDDTRERAKSLGAQVIHTPKGRGKQIKTGVSHARGEVILVLHADCLIRKGVPDLVLRELNENLHAIGGATGMEFSYKSRANYLIVWLNNLRARWSGIAFGDQAQFFRKEALPLIGGFPELMLMEDVELSMRLKEHGSLCFIPKGIVVSNRRWEKTGFWSNVMRVLWLCLNYLVQRRLGIGNAQGREFYERYYSIDRA
jgi:rSAM/selenodomain-associated transferase 2